MTIACPDCGTLQELPLLPPRATASCRLCDGDLETTTGRSVSAALACSLGTFLLLFPVNLLPLLRMDVFGLHGQTTIMGGIAMLFGQGWVLLAGIAAFLVVFLPFIRFGLLSVILACVALGARRRWLGPGFRWALAMDPWAMIDVFLLAAFVGFYRLAHVHQAQLRIEAGGYCLIAAAILTMLSRAVIDRRTIWRALGPEYRVHPEEDTISCIVCDIVRPAASDGESCPRCNARLHKRRPYAMSRTIAVLVAAFVLFFPAQFLPMNVSDQLGTPHSYTIFTGVKDLFSSGLWFLGFVIFCTSIVIPFGKIAVVAWCVLSVLRRSSRRLVAKTKMLRLVAELGRWSNTDPFTIVFFVPLMNFGLLASARADWGATAFVMMTFLSMVASYTFDPRLIWDAALVGSGE